jgi:hypothetical protein
MQPHKPRAIAHNTKAPSAMTDSEPKLHAITLPFNIVLKIAQPYEEGHPLTSEEAAALNALLLENIRNNARAKIKKAQENFEKANPGQAFSAEHLGTLPEALKVYAENYTFSATRPPKAILDPLTAEAHKIARDAIEAALRRKGADPKDYKEKMDDFIADAIVKRPEIMAEAQRRIAARQAVLADVLDDSSIAA